MSQHYYVTQTDDGSMVQVLAGWDRPLGNFFLVVESLSELEDSEAHFIYTNLDDPEGGLSQRETFAYYNGVLENLGIQLPAAMVEALEEDRELDRGNHVQNWNPTMIALLTECRKRSDGTLEPDILSGVAHLPLTIRGIDKTSIAVLTSQTDWTHESLMDLLPQLEDEYGEQLSEGASLYLGNQLVGTTEL
ncbi:hypothetical protein ACT3T8_16050 [Halomonas sp. AOP1-B1-8]|uniref:hypothetical protein n=1 Tax=Halomonas sp. AOP1-B1-8 TaxID=3457726 RepID=UPI003FDBBF6F